MPCRNDGWESLADVKKSYYKEFEHGSPLAEGLCAIMKQIDKHEYPASVLDIPPYIARWWEAHKVRDRKREAEANAKKAAEERRAAALAKLTPADRKLLGLKDD